MDADALAGLPRTYALALRLRELGAEPQLIADCLGLAIEAVPALLALAEAKLANLPARRDDGDAGRDDHRPPV